MSRLKPYLTAMITLFLPSFIAVRLLSVLGHRIAKTAHIGFSWLQCRELELQANSRIGHFNLVRIEQLSLGASASIRTFNRLKGPFDLIMSTRAAIGSSNSIYRGDFPITTGKAQLILGKLAIITSKHQLDCTKSISIGDYSTISGFGTQMWTHGFYHEDQGPERIRIDGSIKIGKNVSVGSRCLLNPGIQIGDAINIGGNVCVAKSLKIPGMYVSQSLRHIPNSVNAIKSKLSKNKENKYVDVYEK